MATINFRSADEYITTHPEDVQSILQRVRRTIGQAVPGAQEESSCQMPAHTLAAGPDALVRRVEAARPDGFCVIPIRR